MQENAGVEVRQNTVNRLPGINIISVQSKSTSYLFMYILLKDVRMKRLDLKLPGLIFIQNYVKALM